MQAVQCTMHSKKERKEWGGGHLLLSKAKLMIEQGSLAFEKVMNTKCRFWLRYQLLSNYILEAAWSRSQTAAQDTRSCRSHFEVICTTMFNQRLRNRLQWMLQWTQMRISSQQLNSTVVQCKKQLVRFLWFSVPCKNKVTTSGNRQTKKAMITG